MTVRANAKTVDGLPADIARFTGRRAQQPTRQHRAAALP